MCVVLASVFGDLRFLEAVGRCAKLDDVQNLIYC